MSDDKTPIEFNVFIGSKLGCLKGINLNKKHVISKLFFRDNKKEITSLAWNDLDDQNEIIIGYENSEVCSFDTDYNCYTWCRTKKLGDGPIVSAFKSSSSLVIGYNSGEIGIIKGDNSTIINTVTKTHADKRIKKPTLCCVKPNTLHLSEIATGGCENDLAIWDLNNPKKSTFSAKNVRNDMLDLRVPIWISGLSYLPNSNKIAIASRHKHIRLYDPKAQRRPVFDFEWGDRPLTSLAVVPFCDAQVVVGTDKGNMALFDLRNCTSGKPTLGVYKGFAGCVKDISVHESLPLIFSISLDRHIRVHNMKSKIPLYRQYLKSLPNCLLVRKGLNESDFLVSEEKPKFTAASFVKSKRQRIK